MANKDGTENGAAGGDEDLFNFGDDDFLDLNFGEEPADLNAEDAEAGTDPNPQGFVTDLSGGKPSGTPVGAPPKQEEASASSVAPQQPAAPSAPVSGQPAQPQAPQGQQQPSGEQPGATAQPTVNIEEFVANNSEAIIANLAGSHFAIDDATAEKLNFTPEVRDFVQRRDARNFVLTMVQVNNALQRTLPTVVAQLVELTQRSKETQTAFFDEFKDLKDPKFLPALNQMAPLIRQANPQMEKAAFQTALGNAVRNLYGMTAPAPTAAPAAQQVSGRTVRRGRPAPFTPAGALTPQRNHAGNGEPPADPLAFMNQMIRLDADA